MSLAEAGNLGDDLIVIAVAKAVHEALPEARLAFLSHGREIDLDAVLSRGGVKIDVERRRHDGELDSLVHGAKLFSDALAVVFGGGGLLQTSHHPMRPYQWLRYLGTGRRRPPTIAVGLGLGPLSPRWMPRLSGHDRFFDFCYVRDDLSLATATEELQWEAQLCGDFVDDAFLSWLGISREERDAARLGVAVRAWPGLDIDELGRHVMSVRDQVEADSISVFVLESNRGAGVDVDFSTALSAHIGKDTDLVVYRGGDPLPFLMEMARCSTAISMKLHSSSVWAFTGATQYPIIYAPKVARFFGRDYRGLEIVGTPAPPHGIPDDIPGAATVLEHWLRQSPFPESSTALAFSLSELAVYGLVSGAYEVWRKSQRLLLTSGRAFRVAHKGAAEMGGERSGQHGASL